MTQRPTDARKWVPDTRGNDLDSLRRSFNAWHGQIYAHVPDNATYCCAGNRAFKALLAIAYRGLKARRTS